MKPIKIAMLSLNNGHAVGYISMLRKHPDFEWVAVSVAPEDRARAFLDWVPSGVKIYETDRELLDAHPDIEAVIVASANYQHFEQFRLCAERGVHMFSMKIPMFNMEEYTEIQQLIKEKHLTFQIELELRFHSTIRRMRELYDSGAIGKLVSMQMYNQTICIISSLPWVANPEQSYGKRVALREGDSRCRGGALADHPHLFDLARYFSDSEFDRVFAEVAPNLRQNMKVEDNITIIGQMKNGVIVSIDPSYSRHENPLKLNGPGWEGYPKRVEVNLILNGERGSILGDCFHSGIYHTGLPEKHYAVRYTRLDAEGLVLSEFASSIRNKTIPTVNIDMHRKTIEAMNACYDSVAIGRAVYL